MTKEKRNILDSREIANGIVKKYSDIRKHLLRFALISVVFAVALISKFDISVWYFWTPFIVASVLLFMIRHHYKFHHDVAKIAYYLTHVQELALNNNIDIEDVDKVVEYSEKIIRENIEKK